LRFIDSSGIGVLMRAKKIDEGAAIGVLIEEGSQVARIFAVAGVEQAVRLFTSRSAAIAALAAGDDSRVEAAD
jgi:anti-anti-sigma regulatory factor